MDTTHKNATPVIDTHVHLDELEDLEAAIDEAKRIGVVAVIAVGSDQKSNERVVEICRQYHRFVYPALGLHPWELGNLDRDGISKALKFIEQMNQEIVAIGEVGLDYDKRVTRRAGKELQKAVLREILSLAREYQKPVILHSRYAWQDCFQLVKDAGIDAGKAVFHWFTGFTSVLRNIVDAGYFVSATPAAEYHEEHRRAIKEAPLDRLLLETDTPVTYGRETKYQSRPADIIRSLKAVATLKGIDEVTAASQTTENAVKLFGLALLHLD
jgi:TatD DNase family protein